MKSELLLLLCCIAAASVSCNGIVSDDGEGVPYDEISHDMIVLGDKLDDPYSVSNIKAALAKAYPTKAGRVSVVATDLYVRFLPESEKDYDRLVALGLNLMDHPLDYEIVRDGDYYHDPELDESAITWQYAVVPPDFNFPKDIRYEILDECFIPGGGSATRSDDGIDWTVVEAISYAMTGNSSMLGQDVKGETLAHAPKGRITVRDDSHGKSREEGLAGVKISCNTFVKFASAYTDNDGQYEMDRTFTTELRYRIVFQNKSGFSIGLNKILVPASSSTMGKSGPEGVSLTVDSNSDKRLFARCVVNNASYDYFERCKEEGKTLEPPPSNVRFWIFQSLENSACLMTQHGVMIDDTFIGEFLGDFSNLVKMFLPDIILGAKGMEQYSSIYAQTVHELAHASHFSKAGKGYWNKYADFIINSFLNTGGMLYGTESTEGAGYCEVGEMWAYFIQNILYKERYGDDMATFGTSYWFKPHILLYLNERGLGRTEIMAALDPEVYSRESLKSRLETLYPDYHTVISQAFERY